MEVHVLPQNSQTPRSQAEVIYRAFSAHEITRTVSEQHLAMLIADTTYDHEPSTYPSLAPALARYIDARFSDRERRDPVLAIKNGEWIQLLVRIRTRNFADRELLTWAGHICKGLGAPEKCALLREAVKKHIQTHNSFDWRVFERAIEVQKRDSEERRRGGS